ncbi:MAG: 3'-5' exonuclease [Eubacteriales bacterium]|nr:3'-5' exonuclease [Eubacteriales bacterium]
MSESYVVVDLETTGLSPEKNRILEIGAVRLEKGKKTDFFQTMVRCPAEIPAFVSELTGITKEICESGMEEREALEQFLRFAGEDPLIGHNLLFDFKFLKWGFARHGMGFERAGIDTLKIARACLSELPSKKLECLCSNYQIPQEKHHRALEDASATADLFLRMKEQFFEANPNYFEPVPMNCKIKKQSAATEYQKRYLIDLIKYHKIHIDASIGELSRSEASRMIDRIILQYGRKKGE